MSFLCNNCSFGSESAIKFNNHQKCHRFKKNAIFDCSHCGQKFYGFRAFSKHSNQHHEPIEDIGEKKSKETIINKCNICDFMALTFHDLYKHFQDHDNSSNFNFNCPICGWSYRNLNSLKSHVYRLHRELIGDIKKTKIVEYKNNAVLEQNLFQNIIEKDELLNDFDASALSTSNFIFISYLSL